MNKNIACLILAAGKSTRMKSDLPKVIHPICGRPMVGYVVDLVNELKINRSIFVLGYKHKEVARFLPKGTKVIIQQRLIGTADAVKQSARLLKNFQGTLLVLYADNPLLKKETVKKLIRHHIENNLDATVLTAHLKNPTGYGRILRDKYSSICGIIEDKDADAFQKDIKEINTGIACFNKKKLFAALSRIRPDNRKKEYYLTDIISILYKNGGLVDGVKITDINEALGINTQLDLAKANRIMQERINSGLMQKGVTIIDPGTAFISFGTKIGKDTTIYPFTVIERGVRIGKRCLVGPFAHLREGTVLEDGVLLGNFLEVVRSRIGQKTWVKHFSYIGDSRIGRKVNIGAGTVTANFDGRQKNTTVIKDKAFIGSDTILVAPVKIGKQAIIGAGSVVTKRHNVSDGQTVFGVPARIYRKKK
ncbi:bifunctional UDP-N-acetylglucosamine diphosphorylase/glucosamine-1-phosphate N-acetyltransferase GlmU [bacterium]|nr:MAG: bifunctional UDP-N-acetylglucosamine diphosphorylase/glucosamine-1-phosphate N-acetyltransferase GlmU [bacterium]